MKKIRVTRTEIMEFEPDPEWYPGEDLSIEEMMQMEEENLKNLSIEEYFDMSDHLVSDKIKFEIVDERKEEK